MRVTRLSNGKISIQTERGAIILTAEQARELINSLMQQVRKA